MTPEERTERQRRQTEKRIRTYTRRQLERALADQLAFLRSKHIQDTEQMWMVRLLRSLLADQPAPKAEA